MGQLEFGSAFSRVFDLYGRYAAQLLTYSAIFYLGVTIVWMAIVGLLLTTTTLGALSALVVIVITIVASMVLTGMYVVALHDANRTGEFPSFGRAWPRVSNRIGALVGTSLLAGLGILAPLAVSAVVGTSSGPGAGLILVPGAVVALLLLTWWAVIAPVVMLEDRSGTSALARSRELVRGNGWTVFGLIIVTQIIVGIAGAIIGAIVGGLLGGSDELLGEAGSQFVSGTLTAPIAALLAIVIYEALTGTGDTPGGPGPDTTGATGLPPHATGVQPPHGTPHAPGTAEAPDAPQPPNQPPHSSSPEDGRSGPFV